jgi:adenosyl cobinamide kinase/adenosyl cobinamide phosphate guanylyltransferase
MLKLNKSGLSTLVLFLLISPLLFSYGKTWMGAELERLVKLASFKLGPVSIKTVFLLNNMGYNCVEEIRKARQVLDAQGLKAKIIAGSTREVFIEIVGRKN